MSEISKQIQAIKRTIAELEAQRSRLESEIFFNYQLLGAKHAAERLILSTTNDFTVPPKEKSAPLPKGTIAKSVVNLFRKAPDNYFSKDEIADLLTKQLGQKVTVNAVYVALKRAEKRREVVYEDLLDAWTFAAKETDEDVEDLPF